MSRPRKIQPPAAPVTNVLQVLDMGLDFRSYLSRVDSNNAAVLGNIVSYNASDVADTFEPTVGLLVTIMHLYSQSNTVSSAVAWLKAYDSVQRVFIERTDSNLDAVRYAREARELIAKHLTSGNMASMYDRSNHAFYEKLLYLLDAQSGIRGSQAPSQRKTPRDPKGAFCNLHLADHKCYQEFACNQLHLHEAGVVRHRVEFFEKLARLLLSDHKPRDEVLRRVKDSLFFARYGNKVTVRCHNSSIPFFKTVYTDGRLDQAFRLENYSCNDMSCTNPQCRGIHPQDYRLPPSSKPMDLHSAQTIMHEINVDAERIVQMAETKTKNGTATSPSCVAEAHVEPVKDDPTKILDSPLTELWKTTVRDYVRQSGIQQVEADESLLRTLQDTKVTDTPLSTSERMTPLLEELDLYTFESSLSSQLGDHTA